MNKEQLERIRTLLQEVQQELDTDKTGTSVILEKLKSLSKSVDEELKEEIWRLYTIGGLNK